MSYEHKEGGGSLFKNDRKQKDTHPDYQGECKIGGVVYKISGWLKDGNKGKWMSLSVQLPRPQGSNVPPGGRNDPRPTPEPEFDDDLPF